MITCPNCGTRPASEFTYAHDQSIYFTLREEDGQLIAQEQDEHGDEVPDNRRIFHHAVCGDYLDLLPSLTIDGEVWESGRIEKQSVGLTNEEVEPRLRINPATVKATMQGQQAMRKLREMK